MIASDVHVFSLWSWRFEVYDRNIETSTNCQVMCDQRDVFCVRICEYKADSHICHIYSTYVSYMYAHMHILQELMLEAQAVTNRYKAVEFAAEEALQSATLNLNSECARLEHQVLYMRYLSIHQSFMHTYVYVCICERPVCINMKP